MKRELVCIVCPNGCEITVEAERGRLCVQGAQCSRGRQYAQSEVENPMRTISTSVLIRNGELPLVSVRLTRPIPKGRIFDAMEQIKALCLDAPVVIGQVVLRDICACGSDVIVTKNVQRAAPGRCQGA